MMPIKKDNEAGFITSKRTKIPCHSVSWNGGKGRQAGRQAGKQAGRKVWWRCDATTYTRSSRIGSTMDADREHRYYTDIMERVQAIFPQSHTLSYLSPNFILYLIPLILNRRISRVNAVWTTRFRNVHFFFFPSVEYRDD